jgi:hypothetical protein
MKKAGLVGKRIEKDNKFALQKQIREFKNRILHLSTIIANGNQR